MHPHIREKILEVRKQHEEAGRLIDAGAAAIQAAFDGFEKDGIVYISKEAAGLLHQIGSSLRDEFKELASKSDRIRPFAEEEARSRWDEATQTWREIPLITMDVRRSKRSQQLVSSLLLVSKVVRRGEQAEEGVSRIERKGNWTFVFFDEEGTKVFHAWREACRTNPVFRIILGVTPGGNP
ncbi:MAG TPA: hypothetical protein VKT73_15340 [Xanthobacteraceae bacterium]|nr:hypothetical protein [Xanthobacteraceae bacterium]